MKAIKIAIALCLCYTMTCGCGKKIGHASAPVSVDMYSSQTETTVAVTTAVLTTAATTVKTTVTEIETEAPRKDIDFDEIKSEIAVIGDSIALGYGAYQRLPSENVFATLNVSPSNINKYDFDYCGSKSSAINIIQSKQPKYILMSMGLNEINTYSADKFKDQYEERIDEFLCVSPNSKIYVMALSPIESFIEFTSESNIDEYNKALSEIDSDYDGNVCYVDAAERLKDSDGGLSEEYSGGDGIHLSGAAYDVLLDGLKEYMELH